MRSMNLVAVAVSFVMAACASGTGDAVAPDGPPGPGAERTCLTPTADRAGTAELADTLGVATAQLDDAAACHRSYVLSTTAALRDGLPANNARAVDERPGAPTLRTGHDLFDALYALALAEVRENSVETISDGAFANGAAIACPAGGCFETGRLWTYVWTRDTAYSVDLGLAGLDPTRARNSLEFKLSAPRAGGPEEIVQDTGTGGSYPVSSDRTTWAFGAAALLPHLDDASRDAFRGRAAAALAATIERDRQVVFDAADGLYRGEQSFLDWREQSYPAWVAGDVAPIASSKALGTNLAHLRAIELAAELGDATAQARYQAWADALRTRIRERFWLEDVGLFSTFTTTHLDPAPARQYDLLGSSLAVIAGVATPAQADAILAAYPHVGPGAAPVIFPQQQLTPIYHNRAEWPFVTAYWLRAAAAADHPGVAERAIRSLMRAAALNLSNLENLEIASGAPFVEDGAYSGPVVNSQRQLWSVAGYVSMIHHTVFGLRFAETGLRVTPYLPAALRDSVFAASDSLILNDVPWRGATITVVLHLPPTGTPGTYTVDELRLNGSVLAAATEITRDTLDAQNRLDVYLGAGATAAASLTLRDATDWRAIFAPRVPAITGVRREAGAVVLELGTGGEDAATVRYNVYRDGTRVASDLAGTSNAYTDPAGAALGAPCYAVETCFATTGNCSQRSRPMCFWGDAGARITSVGASAFTATGGTASSDHGRFHYASWGDATDTLVVPSLRPTHTGNHLLQVVYGNGAGPLTTGITCGLKRIVIEDTATGLTVASGIVVMPQLGSWDRWADSTFVEATLDASTTYRITIRSDAYTANMSALQHFAAYGFSGGASEFTHVNIAELKLLAR